MITDAELEAIERRSAKATEGPWRKTMDILQGGGCISTRNEDLFKSYANPPTIQTSQDCDFIASARDNVPRLVAEVRALRRELEQEHRWRDACNLKAEELVVEIDRLRAVAEAAATFIDDFLSKKTVAPGTLVEALRTVGYLKENK